MAGGSTTHHDDCPSCRFTPLYDTKAYRAQMAAEYPNVCVNNNTATAGGTTSMATTPRETSAVAVVEQRPTRQPCILYCVFVLAVLHLAMFGIFGQTRRHDQGQEAQDRNGGAAAVVDTESYCDGITLSLGSLLVREQTIYCAQNPQRPCSVCGGGGNGLFDDTSHNPPHLACYCYCRVELRRQSFVSQYTEETHCCQCSGEEDQGGGDIINGDIVP